MTPELPIAIPHGVTLNMLRAPVLECCMVRMGQRCNNAADQMIFWPNVIGCYGAIAICDICIDDLPEGWIRALENIEAHHDRD